MKQPVKDCWLKVNFRGSLKWWHKSKTNRNKHVAYWDLMKSHPWNEIITKISYWQLCGVDLVRDERPRKPAKKPLADVLAPKLLRGWPVQRGTVTWDDRETSTNLCTWWIACGATQKDHISPGLQLHSSPSLALWLTAQHWQSGS